MNKKRRSEIKEIQNQLQKISARLESVINDENYYFDSIPDNLQGSQRADESEEAIETLDEVKENIEEIIERLSEVI